jgi:ABC-2 type transport system ATP-binding protein
MLPRPAILFLDEPVSSLDPEGRRDVLELIGQLRGTCTVFMSTHILNDVERVCDRVAILNLGHLVVEGPIGELLDRYAQPIYELEPEPQQPGATEAGRDHAGAPGPTTSAPPPTVRVFVNDPNRRAGNPALVARAVVGRYGATAQPGGRIPALRSERSDMPAVRSATGLDGGPADDGLDSAGQEM